MLVTPKCFHSKFAIAAPRIQIGSYSRAPQTMAGHECRPQEPVQPFFKVGAASSIEASAFSSAIQRRSIEDYPDPSQYIDMDLAIPYSCREKTARSVRRLQKSLDSQEFEFNMSTFDTDLLEPVEVAPADELFFKGQLLPLQHDPRLQLVQTLSSQQDGGDSLEEQSFCPLGQEVINFRSCRLDGVALDAGLLDSRSSSFRSQNSSYWESGEKDSRDSSSSRCSNGSSQDSCYSGEKRMPADVDSGSGGPPAGKSQSQSKRWSWKSLLNGIRKASKIWVDDRTDDPGSNTSQAEVGRQKRPSFPFNRRPPVQSLRSIYTGGPSLGVKKDSRSKYQGQTGSIEECQPPEVDDSSREKWTSGWNRTPASLSSMQNSSGCVERPTKHRTSGHARERWQRYARKLKPLYGMISHHQKNEDRRFSGQQLKTTDHHTNRGRASAAATTHSSSSTPLIKSPLRRDTDNAYSSRYLTVASCPASMRSSPHHSGVLAIVNKGNGNSSMQDLHSAIQGAIAHCKQSHAAGKAPSAAT